MPRLDEQLRTMVREEVEREVSRRMSELRQVRWAVVTQEDPLRVRFPGDNPASVRARPVDGYSPTLGRRALILTVGSRLWAVGERQVGS